MKTIKLLCVAGAAVLALNGCGGGGGSPGVTFEGGGGGGTDTDTGGSGSVPGTVTPSVATSMSFLSLTPTDHPLIIQGATSSGRTDTAVLTFKVVDQVGAIVPNQEVKFTVSPANAVTLNIASATTDANGLVTTSVTSKSAPTTAVVKATLSSNAAIVATSDSLSVSGGDPIAAGFQIVASKYNLNGYLIGDNATISAYVRDAFGNPVPDNFAITFETDYGGVQGSCFTTGGRCDVEFTVQDPRRPASGAASGIATITATGISGGTTITDQVQIHMAGIGSTAGYRLIHFTSGAEVTSFPLTACKQDVTLKIDDGNGKAPAAETTVEVPYVENGGTASVKLGSPVNDARDGAFEPPVVVLSFDVSAVTGAPCKTVSSTGTATINAYANLKAPDGTNFQKNFTISYPK